MKKRFVFLLFLTLFIFPGRGWCEHEGPSEREPWSYRLSEGLKLGQSHFYLGGYVNARYTDVENRRETLSLDNLSLFVFGDLGERGRFFAEVEDEEIFLTDSHGDTESENKVLVERLYGDYLYSDVLNVRGGKFFTPVGTWNEIHAPPLVWTVSRPVVTFAAFPEDVTGLQLFGNLTLREEEFYYAFAAQKNESINEETGFRRSHEFIGGRLRWVKSPGIEVGIPLLYYKEYKVEDRVYLTGLDFLYKRSPVELRGEATYSDVDLDAGENVKEYGYYLQGVYGLTGRFSLVARYDFFQAREAAAHHKSLTGGLAFKPRPPVVFKIEYQVRSGDLIYAGEEKIDGSERLLASFSVLL